MRRAIAKVGNHSTPAIPRGWLILGLALASWALLAGTVFLGSNLFSYISATI